MGKKKAPKIRCEKVPRIAKVGAGEGGLNSGSEAAEGEISRRCGGGKRILVDARGAGWQTPALCCHREAKLKPIFFFFFS